MSDLRYAARTLARAPGFTVVAVLTLALGIGANATIFSVIDAALIHPLPFRDADRLVYVWETQDGGGGIFFAPRAQVARAWREGVPSLESLDYYSSREVQIGGEGEPERLMAAAVSPTLFGFLDVAPRIGRALEPEDATAGSAPVVVLGDALWRRRFGGDPDVLGRTVPLNGTPHTVVGVMPPRFAFPAWARLWVPAGPDTNATRRLNVIARLRRGVTEAQAAADLQAISDEAAPAAHANEPNRAMIMRPGTFTGDNVRRALWVLVGAVGCVLLIACVNVANLLLARGTSRRRELAVRVALGAGRVRLIRQLAAESVALALAGGAGGLLLSLWGLEAVSGLRPETLSSLGQPGLDGRVLFFALAATAVAAVLFGLWPSFQATRTDVVAALKSGDRTTAGSRGARVARQALVVAETALALVLLAGAGLMINSMVRMAQVDPGFNAERLVLMRLSLPEARYKGGVAQIGFADALLTRVRALPGVESAAIGIGTPPQGAMTARRVVTESGPPDTTRSALAYTAVDENYFATYRVPILEGRAFTAADDGRTGGVAIVSEGMARRYWPGQSPVGARFKMGGDDWITVVGVAADVRTFGLPHRPPESQVYVPFRESPWRGFVVAARVGRLATQTMADLKAQVYAIDRDQPIDEITTAETALSGTLAEPRFYTFLLGVFAALALLLAVVGLYGVLAYLVGRRTHEIGVRVALGGRRADIVRLVFGQAMRLVAAGIVLGVAGAALVTRLLGSLLFGVSPTDPLTLTVVAAALALVAAVATLVPARRALKVDPMVALRAE